MSAKPVWEYAVYNDHELYFTIEIPLAFQGMFGINFEENKEAYRQTGDKRYLQSRSRLVVKTNKRTFKTIGFIMTTVPSKNYLEQAEFNLDDLDYQKLGSFSGSVFYHNLEGNYVNGWTFDNGTATGRIIKDSGSGIDVQLKSGTYACDEICYFTYYVWCTDYYVVRDGPDEYMGTYCDYSNIYEDMECTLVYCDDDSDDYCDEYDPASDCYDITLDDPDDGGYDPPEDTPDDLQTPNVDMLYDENSTLSPAEKQKLEAAITEFKSKYPAFNRIYNKLVELGVSIKFKVDNTINNPAAFYLNGFIKFKNESYIKCDKLQEELIHAAQYYGFYGSEMTPEIRNYEFEAKVFQDLACTFDGFLCGQVASIGMPEEFMNAYDDWLGIIEVNSSFTVDDIESFNNFCEEWDNYSGEYDPDYEPELLLNLLNN